MDSQTECWYKEGPDECETEASERDKDTNHWESQAYQTRPKEAFQDVIIEPVEVTENSFPKKSSVWLSLEIPSRFRDVSPEINQPRGQSSSPAGGFLVQGAVELGNLVVREERVDVEQGSQGEGGAPGQADQEEEQKVEP